MCPSVVSEVEPYASRGACTVPGEDPPVREAPTRRGHTCYVAGQGAVMYQWILSTIAAFLAAPFVNSESIVNITAAETIMGRWTSRVRETEWGPLQEDITFGPECHVEIRYTFMKGGGEVEQCTHLAS